MLLDIREKIKEIANKGSLESDYHPIDRKFLYEYLNDLPMYSNFEILKILVLEYPNLFSYHFFLSYPIIFEKINYSEFKSLLSSCTTSFHLYALVDFFHKVLKLDLLGLLKILEADGELKDNFYTLLMNRYNSIDLLNLEEDEIKDLEDYFFPLENYLNISDNIKSSLNIQNTRYR